MDRVAIRDFNLSSILVLMFEVPANIDWTVTVTHPVDKEFDPHKTKIGPDSKRGVRDARVPQFPEICRGSFQATADEDESACKRSAAG